MKYLCLECDVAMEFVEAEGPEEGFLSVTFTCPKCRRRIAFLTNPQETQLVAELGLRIGGRTVPLQPFEQVRKNLARQKEGLFHNGEEEVIWTEEAEKRLEKIQTFVRPRAKKVIEDYARERSYREITSKVMDEAGEKNSYVESINCRVKT